MKAARKPYEKRKWLDQPSKKELWVLKLIKREVEVRPIFVAREWAKFSGSKVDRSSAGKILKRLEGQKKLVSNDANYKLRSSKQAS